MSHSETFNQSGAFLGWVLLNPSTYFAPAMALAGLFAWKTKLLPGEFSRSPRLVLSAAALGTLVYPVGIFAMLFAILALGSLDHSYHLMQLPALAQDTWGRLIDAVPGAAILCAAGMLTVFLTALLFWLATGYLPRKKLLWGFAISSATLLLTLVVGLLRAMPAHVEISVMRYLQLYLGDILFFSLISGVQLPAAIGTPLLAALLGHWLYLAGQKHAISAA